MTGPELYLLTDPRFGPLTATVEQLKDYTWRATLAERHPRLGGIAGAVGESRDQALARLGRAVERSGCDWPRPPRLGVVTHDGAPYTPATLPPPEVVVVVEDGRERRGYAVGWRADEVWVCWAEGGLDGTAWVPASAVRRVEAE
jgi:hypothetical protein